jgi:inorganic triphosphatase YgiF
MNAPREIELKLVLAEGEATRVPGVAPLAGLPRRRSRCVAYYFDTPERALAKRRMGLRLRRAGSHWCATLKVGGTNGAGLHDRLEWEYPAPGPRLDLSRFAATPLAKVPMAETLHERLAPVFVTDFVRTTWLLEPSPGCRMEVALDVGRILAGGSEARIEEVEIELLEGTASAAFDLAELLASSVAMRPEPASKLARGLELAESPRPRPVRGRRVDLSPAGDDARAAARIAMAAALAQAQANEAGVLSSTDVEFVHQLRVSLRRLRSLLRLFGKVLEPAGTAPFGEDLRWAAGALGACRDWDVFVTETLPPLLAAQGDAVEAKRVLRRAQERRREARRAAREAVASSRYGLAMLRLARWLASPPGEAVPGTPGLKDLASERLRKGARRVTEGTRLLPGLDAAGRHALRIQVKRQRYAVEFLGGVFRGRDVARHAKSLAAAQEDLGLANDCATAFAHVMELEPSPAFVGFARGWFAALEAASTARSAQSLARATAHRRFWKRKPRPDPDPPAEPSAEPPVDSPGEPVAEPPAA